MDWPANAAIQTAVVVLMMGMERKKDPATCSP